MRGLITITIAVSLIGCSTKPKTVATISPPVQAQAAPDIPFPKTTDFDDDAEARASYMAAFEQGYRHRLRGGHGMICTFGLDGRRGIAREIGFMQGQTAAMYFMTERDLNRALEQSRRLTEQSDR